MPLFVDHAGTNTLVSQDLDTENNILSIHDRQEGSRCLEDTNGAVILAGYLPLGDVDNPTVRTDPISFSIWVNLTGDDTGVRCAFSTISHILYFENDFLKFAIIDPVAGGSKVWSWSPGTHQQWSDLFVDSWNHIWVGWSSNVADDPQIYINGSTVSLSSTTFLTAPLNSYGPAFLYLFGGIFDVETLNPDATLKSLSGKLQAFGIWESNNSSDALTLYNDGKINTHNIPSEDDIVDFWLLGKEKEFSSFDIGDEVFAIAFRSVRGSKTEIRSVVGSGIVFPTIEEGGPIDVRSNGFIGEVSGSRTLASLNTHRNGPYGFSTWNQLRVSHNPLSRYHRKVNTLTFVTEPGIQRNIGGSESLIVRDRYSRLHNYTEPCVTERHYPVVWNVGRHFLNSRRTIATEPQKFSILSSFGNQLESFTNEDVSKLLNHSIDEEGSDYSEITKLYLDGGLESQDSPITYWEFLQYRESIYPKQINQYRSNTRERPQFQSFFPHSREEQTKSQLTSSLGFSPISDFEETLFYRQSVWPLDEDQFFLTRKYEDDNGLIISGGIDFNMGDGDRLIMVSKAKHAQLQTLLVATAKVL